MAKKFKDLTRPEQIEAIRRGMQVGGTNVSVAKDLGTTPGAVAGIRFKNKIPSLNRPGGQGKAAPARGKSKLKLQNVSGLRVSPSEASRCEASNIHCPYEAKPGTLFCPLHQPKK